MSSKKTFQINNMFYFKYTTLQVYDELQDIKIDTTQKAFENKGLFFFVTLITSDVFFAFEQSFVDAFFAFFAF